MINRFALSFLCIGLDRDKTCGVMLLYILLADAYSQTCSRSSHHCRRYLGHRRLDDQASTTWTTKPETESDLPHHARGEDRGRCPESHGHSIKTLR